MWAAVGTTSFNVCLANGPHKSVARLANKREWKTEKNNKTKRVNGERKGAKKKTKKKEK